MIDLIISLVVFQGSAVIVDIPSEHAVDEASLEWNEQRYEFEKLDNDTLTVLIGVDLDQSPSLYTIPIDLIQGSNHAQATLLLEVKKENFPTTELTVEPQYVQLSPENLARANEESREISAHYALNSEQSGWTSSFIVPLSDASEGSNFGHRRIFNGEPRAPHSGADLAAQSGTPVFASNSGVVILAKNLFFSGNAIFLDHGSGIFTTYLHLSEILIEESAFVEQGELIGKVGATGRVTGPHLHWGARIKNTRIDPFSLVATH